MTSSHSYQSSHQENMQARVKPLERWLKIMLLRIMIKVHLSCTLRIFFRAQQGEENLELSRSQWWRHYMDATE
jgi:hypothetical protein